MLRVPRATSGHVLAQRHRNTPTSPAACAVTQPHLSAKLVLLHERGVTPIYSCLHLEVRQRYLVVLYHASAMHL